MMTGSIGKPRPKTVTFDIYEEESRNIGYHLVSRNHVQEPRLRTECPGLYVQVKNGAGELIWCMLHVGQDGRYWIDRTRGCNYHYGWAS